MAGSTKGGFALGAVLGAVTGALVAWALTGAAPRGAAPAVAAPPNGAPVAAAPSPPSEPPARPAATLRPPALAGRHAALRACQAALAAAEDRANEARSALHDASGKLAEAKAIQAQDEGTPLEPPPGMPKRFMDPRFARKQVQALFDGVGGGEVTSVDCTEFPCLVYADISRDDAKALKQAYQKLRPASYRADGWRPCSLAVSGSPHDKKPTDHLAYAVCPNGFASALKPEQGRRIGWRILQMFKADQGR